MKSKRPKPGNETAAFEKALARGPQAETHLLRLFISGSTPRSTRAVRSIREICDRELHGRYELEVIDIYQHPELAKPEAVVVTPTLVKKLPLPVQRLIGDLSDTERVLVKLDLVPLPDPQS